MIDSLVIRQEREGDSDEIRCVVKAAFDGAEHTDGDEHNLVDRLRDSAEYIPAASFGITAPFDVPSQFYMVFPFKAGVPHGTVRYSRAFRL